ncbi:MAG: hypothetical protein ACAH79_05425, partial [Thermoleophilia bacterium]
PLAPWLPVIGAPVKPPAGGWPALNHDAGRRDGQHVYRLTYPVFPRFELEQSTLAAITVA